MFGINNVGFIGKVKYWLFELYFLILFGKFEIVSFDIVKIYGNNDIYYWRDSFVKDICE